MLKAFLLTTLFISQLCASQPSWFYNLTPSSYEIIGYGVDVKLSNAKKSALADISQTISVNVATAFDSMKRINHEEVSSDVQQNIHTASKAIINGAKVLKSLHKDGLWYVAVVYNESSRLKASTLPSIR